MIQKIIGSIVGFLLLCSIGLNVYFLMGKGIVIDKSTHIQNHNEQFQGQLMVNMMMQKGDEIRWKIKEFKGARKEQLIKIQSFLNTLHPTSSYFAKHISATLKYSFIIYPTFLNKKESK